LSIDKPNVSQACLNGPREVAIQELLENPTYENYKVFCNKAKTLDGYSTKQALDNNRVQISPVVKTLYEELEYCKLLDKIDNREHYLTVCNLSDNNLLIPFKYNDSDLAREVKIKYNDIINKVSPKSKFILAGTIIRGYQCPSLVSNIENRIDKLDNEKLALQKIEIKSILSTFFDPIIQIRNLIENN
jgi:hypothetical protein